MRVTRIVACLAVAVGATLIPARGAAAATAPAPTTSRYMKSTDASVLDRQGCAQGQSVQQGAIVLDFGRPAVSGTSYGTIIFGANTFRSVAQIEAAAKSFLTGYWRCSPYYTRITLLIGTSNYGGSVSYSHGKAWSGMVNNVLAWIGSQQYTVQEDVAAGSDIELSWNTATASRTWVDGYGSIDVRPAYDYGDAAGCPPYGSCNNGWRQEDVWYVSWGAPPAWPLPEIYTTNASMASEWYRMSLYGYSAHGYRMNIGGAMTQYQACLDVGGCSTGTNNTPSAGWSQLYGKLNADSRTAQSLPWSTDITWKN
ncbi:MAG: hypothetical protein ABR548_00615 [Actinomycetota bacterium]|nr:hypothetical protein [Actinomycetota bacterium]